MDSQNEPEKTADKDPAAETPVAQEPADGKQKKKKSFAWRMTKWFLWLVGGLLLFVVVALLTLPLWVNPVVTSVANSLVPKYTDTAFNLGRLDLNPYTGKLLVSGVKLGNPKGYSEADAFSLGSLSAEVEVMSLMSSTIRVRDVTVDALFASWVFDAEGSNNFDRIVATVNEKLGPKKEKEKEPSETKVVIDKVTIKNVRAVIGTGVFELESLTLADFGKATPAKLEISGVKLVNPPGFEAENAFSLGSLSIGMDTGDLGTAPFKIHDFVIDAPYASYVFDERKMDNFTRMLEPLLAKDDAAKDAKKEKKAKKAKKEEASDAPSPSPVTLDKLEVRNLKAQVCKGRIEIASLLVTDYGKPTAALIRLEGVKLANPDGFPEPNAFSLKSLSIGMETGDLSKRPMVFHDILIDSTYAGLVYNDAGVSNFDEMFKPLKGDEKKDDEKKDDEKKDDEKKDEAEESGPRVVIDKLDIAGTKLQYRKVSLPIPLPTFTDIGKGSKEGATAKEVVEQVAMKARDAVGGLGSVVGLFGNDATNLLGGATGFLSAGTSNLLGNATGLVSGGVSNVLGNAAGIIGGGTSNVLGGAAGVISGGTSNVLSGAKGLLGNVLPGGEKKKDEGPSAADKAVEGAKDALKKLGTGGGLFGN